VQTAEAAFTDIAGVSPTVQGMTYGADMRLLVNDGETPTIMFGPGDVRLAHRPDEYVPLEDLKTCTRTLALMILRFCGVQEEEPVVQEAATLILPDVSLDLDLD
jgi:acetylornithine deacetylase